MIAGYAVGLPLPPSEEETKLNHCLRGKMASSANKSAVYVVRAFLIGVLVLVVFEATAALGQQYPFIPITAPNAPQGCMFPFQDRSGGMWLVGCEAGTEGLFYFDGTRFFSPVAGSFPKVVVRGLAEDSDGGIWIPSNGGIYRFYQGQLQKKVEGRALAGITKVAADVFLAPVSPAADDPTGHANLVRISRMKGDWKADVVQDSMQQVQYRLDRTGHVLFACREGYCELAADEVIDWKPGMQLSITRHVVPSLNQVYARDVSVTWRDRFGCIWWRGRTLASYQCPSDPRPIDLPVTLAGLGFPSILELPDGTIGIPSYGRMILGRPGGFKVLNGANGCPNAMVAVAGKDDSVWITSTSGLYVLPLHTKMEFWSARDGLMGVVWSVLHAGNNVFATADISSEILDRDRSHWRVLPTPGGRLFPGPQGTVMAVNDQVIWQMGPRGEPLRHSPRLPVWLMAEAPDSSDWVGGNGVYRLTPSGDSLRPEPKASDQLYIQGIHFDRDGDLWTCSSLGLSHLYQSRWHTISTKDGLLQNTCAAMTEDRAGDFWYAYDTMPVFARIQNPRSDHPVVQQFENADGKQRTYFFASDRRGWLWRGTPNGLYIADLDQARRGEWLHLDRVDGFPAVDTNQNSFSEDRDGSIWFGAEESVIHISPPDDLVHPNYAPAVFVSGLSLNGGSPQMASLAGKIASGVDLVVHIGSLQFDRRNALQIRYRLLPKQPAWTVQRTLDIRLGKLPFGTHTLEVQAQLGSGPWSGLTSKSFTIAKPIWLRWPSLAALWLSASLGAALTHRWRKRRNANKARKLPALAEWRVAALSPEIWHLAGTVLGSRFEVGDVLARGGFATVAQGKDLQQHSRLCAIKIFRQELMDQEWMTKRFQQEVLALEKICHPNVVHILGHGTTRDGSRYLAMEFIEGETLRQKLEKGGLSLRQTAAYLRQLGEALDQIHGRGICHRDLKPENVMIRSVSQASQDLVLIDFSIAIVQDPDVTLHGLSRAAGTIYYMAPEQSIGYADSSTDIYSLAKIVIEMLTGKRLSILLPDASMDLPDRVGELLARLNLGLSSSSIQMISSALEFDPARRPKSAILFANQIARDLESAQPEFETWAGFKSPSGPSTSHGPSPTNGAPDEKLAR
jgi:tRNA A-37 threonylcarbamoyl transferase component Bud32/ligand-binding sensor domain-containing protein